MNAATILSLAAHFEPKTNFIRVITEDLVQAPMVSYVWNECKTVDQVAAQVFGTHDIEAHGTVIFGAKRWAMYQRGNRAIYVEII